MKTRLLPLVATLLASFLGIQLHAQVIRGFNSIYSDNIRGGHVMFGNTAMAIYSSGSGSTGTVNTTRMNYFVYSPTNSTTSIYTNDENNMQFVDIDSDPTTSRSSSADLALPAGTNTIRFARLYWGARIINTAITTNDANIRTIKLKAPGGSYMTYTAPSAQLDKYAISTTQTVYQTYLDITDIVNGAKAGTYTVADMAGSAGTMGGGGGYFGGWTIVVVYENPTLDWNSIRVYDGYLQVYSGGAVTTRTITLTGLNAPEGTLVPADAKLSVMSWEGDAALAASSGNPAGDYLRINGYTYSDAVNPAANMWNGTISKNGVHVTTKNPSYLNQFGIDIDEIDVGGSFGITGGTKEATIVFGTEADQYFPSLFAFSIKMQPPQIQVNKLVTDANGNNFVERYEILTFTIEGWDEVSATGYAYNVRVTDTLSAALEYVAGSMKRWDYTLNQWVAITDAEGDDCSHVGTFNGKTYLHFHVGTGACAATGGTLVQGQHFKVMFQAKALHAVQISNIVRMYAWSEAGELFTDDGFAVIGANQAPLAIRLVAFNGQFDGRTARLQWQVASETNTQQYEVQRSFDGITFQTSGVIAVNGSSETPKNYNWTDQVDNTPPVVFYRLRETGLDGKIFLSGILKLNNGNTGYRVFLSGPNPLNNFLQFTAILGEPGRVDVQVADGRGQVVLVKQLAGMKGHNLFRIDQLDRLPGGMYIVNVLTPEGKHSFRVVKQ